MDINKILKSRTYGNDQPRIYIGQVRTNSGNFIIGISAGDNRFSTPNEYLEVPSYTKFQIEIYTKVGQLATPSQKFPFEPILGNEAIDSDTIEWISQEQIWQCVNEL